jgi:repressor of nif and glnA expression
MPLNETTTLNVLTNQRNTTAGIVAALKAKGYRASTRQVLFMLRALEQDGAVVQTSLNRSYKWRLPR